MRHEYNSFSMLAPSTSTIEHTQKELFIFSKGFMQQTAIILTHFSKPLFSILNQPRNTECIYCSTDLSVSEQKHKWQVLEASFEEAGLHILPPLSHSIVLGEFNLEAEVVSPEGNDHKYQLVNS